MSLSGNNDILCLQSYSFSVEQQKGVVIFRFSEVEISTEFGILFGSLPFGHQNEGVALHLVGFR